MQMSRRERKMALHCIDGVVMSIIMSVLELEALARMNCINRTILFLLLTVISNRLTVLN